MLVALSHLVFILLKLIFFVEDQLLVAFKVAGHWSRHQIRKHISFQVDMVWRNFDPALLRRRLCVLLLKNIRKKFAYFDWL